MEYQPVQLVASGGQPPYRWSTNPGALPPGLSLTPGGQMAGQPTTAGSYTPTFHVDDSAGAGTGGAVNITVYPRLAATPTCGGNGCNVEVTCQAACAVFGTQSGGVPPYQYTLISGTLPSGTTLNGLALAGAMTQAFTYKFSVVVKDALQAPAQVDAVFSVLPHLTLTDPFSTGYHLRSQLVSPSVPYSGGGAVIPTVSWDVNKAPKGFSATVNPKGPSTVVDMTIVPQPGPLNAAWTFTMTLSDSNQCGPAAGQVCSSTSTITVTVVSP